MTRSNGQGKGFWEKIKEEEGREVGEGKVLYIESGGWPVYIPCPIRRALNLRR
jgi:hypothetical protein